MMPPFRRPLLAASLMPSNVEHTNENIYHEMKKLRFPVIATRKIDGIRGLRFNGTLLSRKLKEIPNKRIREHARWMPGGFDVEICNEAYPYDVNESIVMSREHELSDFIQFHIIDWYQEGTYEERLANIYKHISVHGTILMAPPEHHWCDTPIELFNWFIQIEKDDGEGICFRDPAGLYVQKNTLENRSTLKEQILVKLSRFIREDAVIIGFEEQLVNCNPDQRDATGKMLRSKAKGSMYGKDTLGALICKTIKDNREVKVATGLSDKLRYEIWHNKKRYLNETIVFSHKPFGIKNKPRIPIFKGLRRDLK